MLTNLFVLTPHRNFSQNITTYSEVEMNKTLIRNTNNLNPWTNFKNLAAFDTL